MHSFLNDFQVQYRHGTLQICSYPLQIRTKAVDRKIKIYNSSSQISDPSDLLKSLSYLYILIEHEQSLESSWAIIAANQKHNLLPLPIKYHLGFSNKISMSSSIAVYLVNSG